MGLLIPRKNRAKSPPVLIRILSAYENDVLAGTEAGRVKPMSHKHPPS